MSGMGTDDVSTLGYFLRLFTVTVAAILIPPFALIALAPVLLALAPVALVALPFMISAFAGETREVPVVRRLSMRPGVLQQQHAH